MALERDELDQLGRYFTEAINFSRYIKLHVDEIEHGRSTMSIEVEHFHLNGNGTLHGGVYATLIDNTMALAITSLAGARIATTEMNVHFLGPVAAGKVTCKGEMLHRTRRTATAEARVYDDNGALVAMGTGSFRIFEQKGAPIV